jgi:dihydrofolate synthase/folylpolyglutamate synthase
MSWSYEQALAYLDDHTDLERMIAGSWEPPTLERMRALVDLVGSPQEAQPAIHVTGTNGKGSTVRMITALLGAHNLSVGTYTSPDLERVNERLSRNGDPIDDESFAEAVGAIAEIEGLSGIRPHRFEILTLAALRWFADLPVDAAVVEVGLGGRWDATNVVDAGVAVVTNVGLDHTEVLGPTRADVAGEKAGIVKPGSTLVLGETTPALVEIFEREQPAKTWLRDRDFACVTNSVAVGGRAVDLFTPGGRYDDVFLAVHGAHQGENAALAVAAVEAFFDRPLDDDVVREALASVTVPGRFEVVGRSPLVVLDGAHNPDGARAAAATLGDFGIAGDRLLVIGMNRGRDAAEMLEALDARQARGIIATEADWVRAMPAEEIADAARAIGIDVEIVRGVPDAVRRATAIAAEDDLVLVAGSLYVVGEARATFARHG